MSRHWQFDFSAIGALQEQRPGINGPTLPEADSHQFVDGQQEQAGIGHRAVAEGELPLSAEPAGVFMGDVKAALGKVHGFDFVAIDAGDFATEAEVEETRADAHPFAGADIEMQKPIALEFGIGAFEEEDAPGDLGSAGEVKGVTGLGIAVPGAEGAFKAVDALIPGVGPGERVIGAGVDTVVKAAGLAGAELGGVTEKDAFLARRSEARTGDGEARRACRADKAAGVLEGGRDDGDGDADANQEL